ncbi:MAG: response regulator transcription factor [Anaerolineae bacterium]|nr:response regulator transcription factor [Anaerolineae bacterium]
MMVNKPIRVVVADDHEMMRGGLGVFLQAYADLELVGEALNGDEVVELCLRLKPDVLLIELGLRQPDSLEVIHAVLQCTQGIKVIALASIGEEPLGEAALAAGAFCWVLKDVPIDMLAAAIREAYVCT